MPHTAAHLPPSLAKIAAGRDHLSTAEFARATNKAPQTIRRNYHLTGQCYGIRPLKIGGALLWPVLPTGRLLSGRSK